MNHLERTFLAGSLLLATGMSLSAQVYSPKVLKEDQIDTTNLKALAESVYRNAHAVTQREKAEAIWRFYLTDGRFVKPGIFYHIPGWSYEEPMGEVLDPIKLLNSYGFGLCYQDAPLLEATWDAGGFEHTRVWFLTGHTVAEVFYDGQYHYYDADMMGYTTVGNGEVRGSPIASVQQLEADPKLLLSKLETSTKTRPGAVDYPWYPADVREAAISDLAELFSTSKDNYVYGYKRYPQGHTLDFVLRPGERIVRNYRKPEAGLPYLPYKFDGSAWTEFPKDVGSILLVSNGPRSEKDERRWSTGFLEYRPTGAAREQALTSPGRGSQATFSVNSPYVIVDAKFSMNTYLRRSESLAVESSTDDGHTWMMAADIHGSASGTRTVEAPVLMRSPHGTLNDLAGRYNYLVRFTLRGNARRTLKASVTDLTLRTNFEFNPRTLPSLAAGENKLIYTSSDVERVELPVHASDAQLFTSEFKSAHFIAQDGQGYLLNTPGETAELVFPVDAGKGFSLSEVDAGARFLDLRNGLAPDKLTAEVRKVTPWPADPSALSTASIAWSVAPTGPWKTIWNYDPRIVWPDSRETPRVLRWPEVDLAVREFASGTRRIYLQYKFFNLALDDVRLAAMWTAGRASQVSMTYAWSEDGVPRQHVERFAGSSQHKYTVTLPTGVKIDDDYLELAAQ